jgi:Predicted membrane protein
MQLKKLVFMALLTAVALIIFTIEAQIPNPIPIPGIKLGLANIVTVYAMFVLGPKPTLMILVCRIILGSFFSGQMVSLIYSMAGGLLCYASMLLLRKVLSLRQIWVCSVIGAVCHNVGQISVAILLTRTLGMLAYVPFLLISGILAGFCTGICAQKVVLRFSDRVMRELGS